LTYFRTFALICPFEGQYQMPLQQDLQHLFQLVIWAVAGADPVAKKARKAEKGGNGRRRPSNGGGPRFEGRQLQDLGRSYFSAFSR
jgi:hypothetical protein